MPSPAQFYSQFIPVELRETKRLKRRWKTMYDCEEEGEEERRECRERKREKGGGRKLQCIDMLRIYLIISISNCV